MASMLDRVACLSVPYLPLVFAVPANPQRILFAPLGRVGMHPARGHGNLDCDCCWFFHFFSFWFGLFLIFFGFSSLVLWFFISILYFKKSKHFKFSIIWTFFMFDFFHFEHFYV
jgi:hypothetical protein